tara:strand:+ start:229 stop:537 length:309 start_codon:yes stop_codon:yes gene_type:complete
MENSSAESLPVQDAPSAESQEDSIAIPSPAVETEPSSPAFKNAANPYTALSESIQEGVGGGPKKMRFFGPRFMTIWVMPIAVTGIIMEILFVGPLRNANPFN